MEMYSLVIPLNDYERLKKIEQENSPRFHRRLKEKIDIILKKGCCRNNTDIYEYNEAHRELKDMLNLEYYKLNLGETKDDN